MCCLSPAASPAPCLGWGGTAAAFCDDVLALPLTVDRGKTDFLVRKAQCLYSNVPYCTQSSEQTSIHASFNAYSELNPEGSPFFRAVAADGLFARVFFFFFKGEFLLSDS